MAEQHEKNCLALCDLYRLRLIFTSKDCATHVPLVLIQVLVPLWEPLRPHPAMTNEEKANFVRFRDRRS
jgi:hypothetical protein